MLRDIEKRKWGTAEAQLFYCGSLNLLLQHVEESRGNICSRPNDEISPTWSTPSTRRRSASDASACLCSVDIESMLQSGILERVVFRTEQASRDKRRPEPCRPLKLWASSAFRRELVKIPTMSLRGFLGFRLPSSSYAQRCPSTRRDEIPALVGVDKGVVVKQDT